MRQLHKHFFVVGKLHPRETLTFKTRIFCYFWVDKKAIIMLYGQVSIDPEIMSGAPVFAGTRVPIQNLFDYLESGEDLAEFLDDFPSVTKEAALAILEMAKKSLTTEKVLHENFA
jgi:uncharacterized protein (DUF433 family)